MELVGVRTMKRKFSYLVLVLAVILNFQITRFGFADDLESISLTQKSPAEGHWNSGIDIVIAKPLYSNNLALRNSSQVSSQQQTVENIEFDYDFETSPRVWVGYESASAIGVRASWWQYANQTDVLSLVPSANGFGRIEHPAFGDIDISAITPTELMLAQANLDVYAIDLELTRRVELGAGTFLLSGGIRFASLNQNYSARLLNSTTGGGGQLSDGINLISLDPNQSSSPSNSNSALAGGIDYRQNVRGIGPTMSASVARSLTERWHWFATGRASLLMGEGEERLTAGEDLDFLNPQRTTEVARRDQLLPIMDLQIGTSYSWQRWGSFQPTLRGGWEISWWGDVGNNSGGPSDLGFAGFFVGLDGNW